MHIRQLAIAGIIATTLTTSAFADGIPQTVDRLTAHVETLEARIASLEALLTDIYRGTDPQTGQDTLQFSGMMSRSSTAAVFQISIPFRTAQVI